MVSISGPVSEDRRGPHVVFTGCVIGSGCDVDLTWLKEVPGLEEVRIVGVTLKDCRYGREELWGMFVGRKHVSLKGCRICNALILDEEGLSDVCPDELSYRCVMST